MIMLSIPDDDASPLERRRSSFSLPFSPLSSIIGGFSSKSFDAYAKLHQEPLNLTVCKLDGSSFDIQVTKSATVLDLKQAVEEVFSDLQQKESVKISWTHVWGHFCLSYDDQKLVVEKDQIRYYGIKDGDQLHFTRHRTVNYNLVNKALKKSNTRQRISSSSSLDSCDEKDQDYKEHNNYDDRQDLEQQDYAAKDVMGYDEPRTAQFFTSWFSYSRLPTSNARSVSIGSGVCNGVKNLVRLCSDKPYNRKDTWRVD